MKLKHLLPILGICLFFNSCVESISRPVTNNTIAPEFSIVKETLNSRVSTNIPAENIYFSSTKTKKSGEAEYHTLNVEMVPDTLPTDGVTFSGMTNEIKDAVESGISNIQDYQKMKIEVRRTSEENGIEHHRSYKTEINL